MIFLKEDYNDPIFKLDPLISPLKIKNNLQNDRLQANSRSNTRSTSCGLKSKEMLVWENFNQQVFSIF